MHTWDHHILRDWVVFRDVDRETGGLKKYNGKVYSYYWIIRREFWELWHKVDDRHLFKELPEEIQKVCAEDMEGHFEFQGTMATVLPLLTKHGLAYYGDLG